MMDLFLILSDKNIKWPKEWNDLETKEAEHLAELLMNDMSKESYIFSFGMYLLAKRVPKIGKSVRRRYKYLLRQAMFSRDDSFLLDFKSIFLLSIREHIGWILEEPNLTKAPYPVLKGYKSLSDCCSDMCYLEYMSCEMALNLFKDEKSKNNSALDELMSIIYAPVNKVSGGRCWLRPEEEKKKEILKKRLRTIPIRKKMLCLYFWISCYAHIRSCFPEVFTPLTLDENRGRNFGHAGLLIELAGDKFGTVDQTAESNLYTLFTHLEKEIIKYNEFKEKYSN